MPLDIHFLNVGHGDCTIIDFPNHLTVIDINACKTLAKESEEELKRRYAPPPPSPLAGIHRSTESILGGGRSGIGQPNALLEAAKRAHEQQRQMKEATDRLTNPVEYLNARVKQRSIFRYIQTHPDLDHMAGLYRLWVEERYEIVNFWDTKHCVQKDEDALRYANVNKDIKDWHAYQQIRKSTQNPTVLHLKSGDTGDFWSPDGVEVWAPFDHSQSTNVDADPNSLSYVLLIKFGNCNIVIGGDAPEDMWKEIYQRRRGMFPKVHLLKASHHGRKSGYHYESVKAMNPEVTILSVGELKKKDDAAASYERYNRGCYSTLDHGNIIARCWENGGVVLYDQNLKQIP